MAGIGYITTGTFNSENTFTVATDESVCGMLFDLSEFTNPFDGYSLAEQNLSDNAVCIINSISDAEDLGITENGLMNGVPYYHISQFYNYIGKDTPLYICFTDNGNQWPSVEQMQMAAQGKIFQIGVWTTQPMFVRTDDNKIGFSDLLGNLEAAAEEVSGKVGQETGLHTPLSLIVCGNSYSMRDNDTVWGMSALPDATTLNFPKVSVCLMQNGTDTVHSMQTNNPNTAPVGCLGLVMACLNLAYAEENIGYVAKFNLNRNDDINDAEVVTGQTFTSLSDISYVVGNIAATKGYIIPCQYKGKVAEVFFSSDPTLSGGDYQSIANNRVMHKVRRATYQALLPYINSSQALDTASGNLSATAQTVITTAIQETVEAIMKNPLGQKQMDSFTASVTKSSSILDDDSITVETWVTPASSNSEINERNRYDV